TPPGQLQGGQQGDDAVEPVGEGPDELAELDARLPFEYLEDQLDLIGDRDGARDDAVLLEGTDPFFEPQDSVPDVVPVELQRCVDRIRLRERGDIAARVEPLAPGLRLGETLGGL